MLPVPGANLPPTPIRSYGTGTTVISGGTRLGGPAITHSAKRSYRSSVASPKVIEPKVESKALPLSPANNISSLDSCIDPASLSVSPALDWNPTIRAEGEFGEGEVARASQGEVASANTGDIEGQLQSSGSIDTIVSCTPRKRKIGDTSSTSPPPLSSSSALRATPDIPSSQSDMKSLLPIPILPVPLPSKRFKKSTSSKAVLIPVEQLPVYPLPPLPPIRDPGLAKQVFIHSSSFPRSRSRFEDAPDRPTEHYEKLEHVGDSVLGMVVTTWLHEIKPGLTCGTASKLKAHLVSNATLSHLSGMYNLPQRLQGDPSILPVLRAQTDVRAALMEAYIAALYFSFPIDQRFGEGIRVIDAWLREMYEPLYEFFYDYMKNEYEQHHLTLSSSLTGGSHLHTEDELTRIDTASQGMANLLQMYCYRQDRELHFDEERSETHCGILWRLKCLVDGIEVGEATRSGRKVAKNVSAWEACKRLGLVKEEEPVGEA